MNINVKDFVTSYLETASWVLVESSDENREFTDEAIENAKRDCLIFISLVIKEFGAENAIPLLNTIGEDLTHRTAHDFFLTRNGHGAGFWDNPNIYNGQENADKLTEIAEKMGSTDCYHIENSLQSKLTYESKFSF